MGKVEVGGCTRFNNMLLVARASNFQKAYTRWTAYAPATEPPCHLQRPGRCGRGAGQQHVKLVLKPCFNTLMLDLHLAVAGSCPFD